MMDDFIQLPKWRKGHMALAYHSITRVESAGNGKTALHVGYSEKKVLYTTLSVKGVLKAIQRKQKERDAYYEKLDKAIAKASK